MTAYAVTVLLQILIDDLVDKRHAAGVVQLLGRVAGTLVHTGEVHIDNAYGTIVSRQPVGSYAVGLWASWRTHASTVSAHGRASRQR